MGLFADCLAVLPTFYLSFLSILAGGTPSQMTFSTRSIDDPQIRGLSVATESSITGTPIPDRITFRVPKCDWLRLSSRKSFSGADEPGED